MRESSLKRADSESQIQADILRWLESQEGLWCCKVVSANRNGVPDILVCVDGVFLALEVKREGGKTSELQKHNMQCVVRSGGWARVVTGLDEVKETVEKIRNFVRVKP